MLKNKKDFRSVVFMIITTTMFICLWKYSTVIPLWLMFLVYPVYIMMSITVLMMTHNHNHVAMWKNRYMNIFQENWLTVFYGFPIFAWIPTHNKNHHIHINTEEDYTNTYNGTEDNNLLTLVSYPTKCTKNQIKVVIDYYKDLYTSSRKKFFFHTLQILSLLTWLSIFFFLDWQKALFFVFIPQQFCSTGIWIFNYVQHVHADETHKYNHSRNFIGKFTNYFLLNGGLHLAHHIYPSQHWSELQETHNEVADKVDPSLMENSYIGYILKTYFLSIFIPKYRSKSLRTKRIQLEQS